MIEEAMKYLELDLEKLLAYDMSDDEKARQLLCVIQAEYYLKAFAIEEQAVAAVRAIKKVKSTADHYADEAKRSKNRNIRRKADWASVARCCYERMFKQGLAALETDIPCSDEALHIPGLGVLRVALNFEAINFGDNTRYSDTPWDTWPESKHQTRVRTIRATYPKASAYWDAKRDIYSREEITAEAGRSAIACLDAGGSAAEAEAIMEAGKKARTRKVLDSLHAFEK